jgi:hypothetical protein
MGKSSTHAPVREHGSRSRWRLRYRFAVFATALVTVLGMGAWLAPAVSAAPTALMGCSARGSGSPGFTTFTLHMSNSCGFPTRAVTLCEPDLWPAQGLHWAYGAWRYGSNSGSVANCGAATQAQLQWGYDTPTVYREIGHVFYYGPAHRASLVAPRQPSANVVPSAYGSPGFSSLTLHVTNTKGWQVRATLLCFHGVNGRRVGAWGHGPWISRPGTSTANCPFYPSDGVTAFGFDWGSPGSYQYYQIGYL